MELEHINDGNVRITITKEDLADRGLTLIDLMSNQQAVEEFFYTILDEAGIADEFQESSVLSFQVIPKDNQLEVYVSRDDAVMEDTFEKFLSGFSKSSEEISAKKSDAEVAANENNAQENSSQEFVYFSLEFNDFENIILLAKDLFIEAEATELYKLKDKYYLIILLNQLELGHTHVQDILGRVIEYGEKSPITRDYLVEYGQSIVQYDAIEIIRKNF